MRVVAVLRFRGPLLRKTLRLVLALAITMPMAGLFAPDWQLVGAAYAQCVTTGNTVTCAGTDTDGFNLGADDLDSFTVEANAEVDASTLPPPIGGGPDAVVFVNDTVTVFTNFGTITTTFIDQAGVDVGSIGSGGFINHGTISVLDSAPAVFVLGDMLGGSSNSGSLIGGSGIDVQGDLSSFFNSGRIVGSSLNGILVGGSIGNIGNTGSIIGEIDGVFAASFIDSLFNSGTIIGGIDGVHAFDITSLVNTGLLQGNSDEGVYAFDTIGSLINFGTIRGGDDGVQAEALASLANHGVIQGTDDGVDVSEGPIDSLINHGVIAGGDTAPGSKSGVVGAVIRNLVNSGTISSLGFAIEERGPGDNTNLSLNAGSILIGVIDLGGGTNILNIGAGRSINSRFDSDDGIATLPVLGTLAGHLVAFSGTATEREVVAVDPSAFASADEALAALTAGIGQTVQGRQAALRSDPALGFSAGDLTDMSALSPNRFWIEGFGAYREDNGDRVGSTFDSLTGGLVAGVDVPVDALTSVGVMAGFAASTSENETNTQETDTTSYYAGVYASTEAWRLAWDASLTVGYSDYDQERITANNLVANGLETARADFGGWFINPQVTMTREASNPLAGSTFGALVANQNLEQSLTFSYAGLFLDGYTETGTSNPLTLDNRSVHIASARAALALPFEANHTDGALTTIRMIGGVEVRTQFGDDAISGTLLGQSVTTTLDDDATFGGFLGLAGEYQTPSGLTAYANAEGLVESDASWNLSANAGLRIAF